MAKQWEGDRLDETEKPECVCVLQEIFHSNETDYLKRKNNKKVALKSSSFLMDGEKKFEPSSTLS